MTNVATLYGKEAKEKTAARQFLIDHALASGINIERAFTMPSRKAVCAGLFKAAFGCEVIGVDYGEELVRSFDNPSVDTLYCGDVFAMAEPDGYFRLPITVKAVEGYRRELKGRHRIPGKFDFMFLDYTSLMRAELIEKTNNIIDQYAKKKAVVGVTFTRAFEMSKQDEDDLVSSLMPTWQHYRNDYQNGASQMTLIALVRK